MMAVAVFGSINMDLVVRASHLPLPGQTLSGQTFYTASGGKGANQAVACARLGVVTHMIGCVGRDVFGQISVNHFKITAWVSRTCRRRGTSGVALITVDDQAENTIVIITRANGLLKADPATLDTAFGDAKVLLLQLEVPLAETIRAAEQAQSHHMTVILDPAPAQALPADLYRSMC